MTTTLADSPLADASWIWLPGYHSSDTYACFRRQFALAEATESGYLDISVDTDFIAFLNGVEIGRGQFSDFPRQKSWSRLQIPSEVLTSDNLLAIAVHYRGTDAFDHQKGRAGLIAGLQIGSLRIVSDPLWKTRLYPGFRSGHGERMTMQTGLTFSYDARKESEWTHMTSSEEGWIEAEVVQKDATEGYWQQLEPRPLPPLKLNEMPEARVAFQGAIIAGERGESIAATMANTAIRAELPWFTFENGQLGPSFPGSSTLDEPSIAAPSNAYGGAPMNAGEFLSIRSATPLVIRPPRHHSEGQFFIVDLKRETVGLLEFEIEAEAGTVLHIAHGEHLDDGRVRMKVGQRHFADRYICTGGRRRFQMPFRRIAARYLEVHCFSSGKLAIHAFGLRPVEYPTERKGSFTTNDPLARIVHDTAIRTLELCRHEHYEDCPWREQALYGYDSRFQALYGYYAFGDYRFPEVSFKMLHETMKESGFLGLIAPGDYPVTIPSFSFAWIAAVAEHWLYSGSDQLYRQVKSSIAKIVHSALALYDEASGLYALPEGDDFWNFYEWTAGLAGEAGAKSVRGARLFHAAYQLHFHEALRSAIWLSEKSGDDDQATAWQQRLNALSQAIHRNFWDEKAGIYRTIKDEGEGLLGAHELIQALALYEGIVPEKTKAMLIHRVIEGHLSTATLSASYYLIRPLLEHSCESRDWIIRRLSENYESMILKGATSLWETAAGGADFDYAGSLCHGWSALPVYLHQASLLGVTPLEPGFRSFAVRIHPSRHLIAEGKIPTPYGNISIHWQRERAGIILQVSAPPECHPVLSAYPDAPYVETQINGEPYPHY